MSYNAGYHPGFGPTNNSLFNGDGFGVGWYHQHAVEPAIFRDVLPAWSDSNLREVCHATRARVVMAHVRAASPGSVVSRENCHPFKAGRLMFCHNGRIDGYWKIRRLMLESLTDEAFLSVRGTTDSEVAFAMILSNLDKDSSEEGSPFHQKTPFGAARLEAAMERSIQQIKEFCEVCQTEQFCRGFTTLNYSLTDGETVIMTRYCDKTPHIPPPSLYFAFGLTKEIHKIIGDGGRSGTNDGPGDGSATPVLTKAENNKRIEEAMKKEEPIDEHQESTLCQSFLDEWEGKPTDDCALVVASDPLTFCENRWFPVPSNSILWCDKGGLPKMRKLEGC